MKLIIGSLIFNKKNDKYLGFIIKMDNESFYIKWLQCNNNGLSNTICSCKNKEFKHTIKMWEALYQPITY